MNNILSFIVASIFIIFALSGCVRNNSFLVNIDSIGAMQHKTKYILMSSLRTVSTTDLEFKEYSKYIERALQKDGFKKVDFKDADIAIFLKYGISKPHKHTESYTIPIRGQTGVSSSTTYSSSNTNGTLNTYGNTGYYQGTTYSSKTTNYTPTYGIIGYESGIRNYVTFTKYYELSAADLDIYRKSKKYIEVWKIMVTNTDSSEDLRELFPIMVAASQEYIGLSTGKKIKVKIYEQDKKVMEIKGLKKNKKDKESMKALFDIVDGISSEETKKLNKTIK